MDGFFGDLRHRGHRLIKHPGMVILATLALARRIGPYHEDDRLAGPR